MHFRICIQFEKEREREEVLESKSALNLLNIGIPSIIMVFRHGANTLDFILMGTSH